MISSRGYPRTSSLFGSTRVIAVGQRSGGAGSGRVVVEEGEEGVVIGRLASGYDGVRTARNGS